MALTDSDYNAFASALVSRLADRLRGLDAGAHRLVGTRPQDHVLAGFLTPAEPEDSPEAGEDDLDDALASDLPRDSTYEQTSVGAEWLMPVDQALGDLQVTVAGAVYARRIPDFDEQNKNGVWQTITDPIAGTRRFSELVPVWTRERFDPILISLSLADLSMRRRLRVDLSTQLSERLQDVDTAKLFPGRRPVRVDASQLTDISSVRRLRSDARSDLRSARLAARHRYPIGPVSQRSDTRPGSRQGH